MNIAPEIILEQLQLGASSVSCQPLTVTIMSPMHMAVENDLWLVSRPGQEDTVLRVLRADVAGDFDPEALVAGALAAAATGAGPRVLAQDAGRGALLQEYLGEGWRTATLWDLYDPKVRRGILDATRRLHQAAPVLHRFDPLVRLENAISRGRRLGVPLPDDLDWLSDGALQIGETVGERSADLALCRNDGASSNIMVHDDHRVLLIDYDQAGMNDPAYDLGVLMAEASVFEDEAMAWLKEWDPQASYPLLYRAQLYGALDDLLWAVRAAVQAHISERIHVEFRKYSEWRFMRARRILADRRFEWMLRVVNEA